MLPTLSNFVADEPSSIKKKSKTTSQPQVNHNATSAIMICSYTKPAYQNAVCIVYNVIAGEHDKLRNQRLIEHMCWFVIGNFRN